MPKYRPDVSLNFLEGLVTIFVVLTVSLALTLFRVSPIWFFVAESAFLFSGLFFLLIVLGTFEGPKHLGLLPQYSALSRRHRVMYVSGLLCLAEFVALLGLLAVSFSNYWQRTG